MNKTMYNLATIAGFVVGVVSYFYTALQLFWDEHGDNFKAKLHDLIDGLRVLRFEFDYLATETGEWYRNVAQPVVARGVDQLYFRAIDM